MTSTTLINKIIDNKKKEYEFTKALDIIANTRSNRYLLKRQNNKNIYDIQLEVLQLITTQQDIEFIYDSVEHKFIYKRS